MSHHDADSPREPTSAATGDGPSAAPRPSLVRQALMAVLALVVIAIAGWNVWSQLEAPQATSYRFDESKPYPFLDDVASNATPDATGFEALQFEDTKGEPWDLARYRGTANVVLVITRGRTSGQPAEMHRGRICLYCASQTAPPRGEPRCDQGP